MSYRLLILLFVGLFSASTSSLFARYLPDVPAVSIAFWRMVFGASLLWVFSFFRKQGRIPAKHIRNIISAGIFLGLHFACFFIGLKHTTVANAVVLATMGPFFTTIFERFLYKRSLSGKTVTGLIVALIGVVVIQGFPTGYSGGSLLGNGVALLSSFWIALALILAEKIRQTSSALSYSRAVYSIAAMTLFIIGIFSGVSLEVSTGNEWAWLFMLGLIPTVVGHGLFNYTIKFVRPTVVASVPLGEPVIASLLVWIFLGEIPGSQVIFGGFVVLTGLFLITRTRKQKTYQVDVAV